MKELQPYIDRATLVRIATPAKIQARLEHAYKANCGVVDPNNTTPIDRDLCRGNLVCMTYFCVAGTFVVQRGFLI